MALPVTITGINTTVACVGPFKLATGTYSAGAGITAGITQIGNTPIWGNSTQTAVGQTFTNGASALIIPSAVALFGSLTGSPTGNVYCEITSTDMNGSVLATSNTIAASACAGSVTFTFASPPTISASATFGVRFWRTVADGSNYMTIGTATSTVYAGGNAFRYNGSTWSDASADLVLTVNKAITVASDAYYFFGRNGTTATTLSAYKSTAPDTSWASIATKTGFTTAILNLAAYQSGTTAHILVQDGTASTSLATKYVSYDMITDTFLATTETVSAAVAVTGQGGGALANASIVVRSNGEVVAFYTGVQTKTSGTFRMRCYYRRRTAVNTWTAETQVDNNTAVDNQWPIAVLGATDRVHFVWCIGAASTFNRTLSAANSLNTATSHNVFGNVGDAVSYDRGGVTKVVVTTNTGGQFTEYFNSADNPTINTANQSIAAASIPHRIGTFPNTDDVTIVYRSSADSDLYSIKSSDDGATFAAPVSFFVGTVANVDANVSRSSSGSVYVRGSNNVVGYLVNDNGTLKYNENVVSAVATSKTWVKQSGTWKLATTWVKDAGTWKKPTKSFVKKAGVWTEV